MTVGLAVGRRERRIELPVKLGGVAWNGRPVCGGADLVGIRRYRGEVSPEKVVGAPALCENGFEPRAIPLGPYRGPRSGALRAVCPKCVQDAGGTRRKHSLEPAEADREVA